MFPRFLYLAALVLAAAGCSSDKARPYADDAAIAAVSYRGAPPALTLYTMVNNRTGRGAHTSLRIDASESVAFDPAGSFYADVVPERNDVLFGFSPRVEKAYRSAHARETHHVVIQSIPVSREQAETAYRLALANGRVADAFCASATSRLLQQVPGFGSIRSTMYPINLLEQFARLPGVTTEKYYENDSGDLSEGLVRGNAALAAE